MLFLSEGVNEYSHGEAELSLDIYEYVNERVPLEDELAQFVSGHVQTVETGPAKSTFHGSIRNTAGLEVVLFLLAIESTNFFFCPIFPLVNLLLLPISII